MFQSRKCGIVVGESRLWPCRRTGESGEDNTRRLGAMEGRAGKLRCRFGCLWLAVKLSPGVKRDVGEVSRYQQLLSWLGASRT